MRPGLLALVLVVACRAASSLDPVPAAPALEANLLAQAQFDQAFEDLAAALADDQRRGRAFGRLGMLFHAYDYELSALACYRNATRLEPAEAAWHYYLAQLEISRGRLPDAEAALERTLELEPGDLAAMIWLARVAHQAGDSVKADARFEAVLVLDEFNPEATYHLAQSALAAGRPEVAIDILEPARQARPRSRLLRFGLGRALAAAGQEGRATELLDTAGLRAFDPPTRSLDDSRMQEVNGLVRGGLAHERRGQRALEKGQLTVAVSEFRQALSLDSDYFSTRHNLAVALLRLGRRDEAVETLRENLVLSSGYVPSWVLLASLVSESGDHAAAEEFLELARAADPDAAIVHAGLGELRRRQELLEAAVAEFREALRLQPNLEDAWFGLAVTHLEAGRSERAERVLEEGLQVLPGESRLLGLAARCRAVQGDVPGCLAALETLDLAAAAGTSLMQSAGMAQACAGRWDDAVRAQERVLASLDAGSRSAEIARRRLEVYRRQRVVRRAWARGEQWSEAPTSVEGS